MILYKYTADCSKLNLEQEDSTKEGYERLYSRRSDAAEWNSKFYTAYRTEKKFFIMISDILNGQMTIVAALEMEVVPRACVDCIQKILPEIELLACEEITNDAFCKELVRAERNNWTECYSGSLKEKLKLAIEPEHHSFFEPVAYQVSERIYTAQNMTRQKQAEQMQEIMASESFYDEMERIYAPENEKRFVGHPVHYLITAGDKAAADDMIDLLIPALLENQRLLSGRVYDVQKMTYKAEREDNFDNIFSSARGGTVILNLEGEKSTGMYATGNYDLAKTLGKKLNEYGNSTLFIFVDISGSRSVSDETIAEILSNADLIQIQEGQGDLERATGYLKRLADRTEYHDYTIEELTRYLPKEKNLYSVSDIFNAYNRWYGRGLKTHIYKAYKEKDLVKIELKKKTDKPYVELQKMVGLADVKKVTDEILAAAKMQKMRKMQDADLAKYKADIERYFPDVSDLLFWGRYCTSIGFPDSYVHRILNFEKIGFKGQLYSHEHQQSFRTEGSWAKLERSADNKHTFELKIDGVSVFQRFKDMARKLLEKMGFRQPQPKQGKAYTISLTY